MRAPEPRGIATEKPQTRAMADFAGLGSRANASRFLEQFLPLCPEILPRLSFDVRELLQRLGFARSARASRSVLSFGASPLIKAASGASMATNRLKAMSSVATLLRFAPIPLA
jgi:hypothetical protein